MTHGQIIDGPHPWCLVRITHPAHGYTSSHQTDIRATLEKHRPVHVCAVQDDYELTDALDYLERVVAYKP
jgi:hypothetical protein